jgi:3-deoxy-D-manno-octulosonic-acid transferase
MLRRVKWMGVQTRVIRRRFVELGARPADVQVLPTLKYDNAEVGDDVKGSGELGAAMGLMIATPSSLNDRESLRLIVGGSTGPGEEEQLLDMYMQLRSKFHGLRLAIVPRHPEVVPPVIQAIKRRGLKAVKRTERMEPGKMPIAGGIAEGENQKVTFAGDEVFVLDTMGELKKIYALAFAVFVGRSLIKRGGGGSDMIEVAALGKPCCFGPYTSNFTEVVEMLVEGNGAVVVRDSAELTRVVEHWLLHQPDAQAMGGRAQELIRQQQAAQATQRYVEKLLQVLELRTAGQSPHNLD